MAITENSPRKMETRSIDSRDVKTCLKKNDHGSEELETDIKQNDILIKDCSKNEVRPTARSTNLHKEDVSILLENDLVSAEEYLQKFLLQTLGKSDSRVYDILSQHGLKRTFHANDSILKQGETKRGIYIIITGNVEILTSDNENVLTTLNARDIFGDVSTLFNIPVTANVTASTDVTLVSLKPEVAAQLFKDFEDLDIIDWFIKRRYLPTGTAVDSANIYRRMALKTINSLPLFRNWTDGMLKKLILTFEHNAVTLYPERSIIILEQDPLASVYIIQKGKVEIKQASRIINVITVTSESEPFVYTELALLVDRKVSPVSIKALTDTQVINLKREWVMRVLEGFPGHMDGLSEIARLFRVSFERLGHIYLKNEADLQIEILCNFLSRSRHYCALSTEQLRKVVLNGDLREFEEGSNVVFEIEHGSYESIVVIRGEVELISRKFTNEKAAVIDLLTQFDGEWPRKAAVEYDSDNDVGDVKVEQDNMKQDINKHLLAVGSVVDGRTVAENSMSLIAKTSCIILKIREYIDTKDTLSNVSTVGKVTPKNDLKLV